MLDGPLVEQDLGPVVVGIPEEVAGIRFTAVDVGNPHAVVEGDPADLPRVGPLLETHERFPARTNVQVARGPATRSSRASGSGGRARPPPRARARSLLPPPSEGRTSRFGSRADRSTYGSKTGGHLTGPAELVG